MSASFPTSAELPIANGVGTVGYTVYDADGEELVARTTSGVVRLFEGSNFGIYQAYAVVPAGVLAGTVVWDDGDDSAEGVPFFIGNANAGAVTVGSYSSTLDAEWGGSSADSYVSLSDAEDLILDYVVDKVEWDAGTGQKKDAALRMATRQIDSMTFLGSRLDTSQTLKFPRAFSFPCMIDRTASQMESDVRIATIIQAAHLLRKGGRDVHAENIASGIRQSSESVGPIRDQFTYTGGFPSPICTDALKFISQYRGAKQIFRA